MEKNVELAYKVLDHIRDNPQEWNQRTWLCASTACFAGRTALISLGLSGYTQVKEYSWTHVPVDIPEVARKALGWSEREGSHVFQCFTNDFAVLERAVKEVLNGDVQDSIIG